MIYIVVFVLLIAIELLYFRIALRYRIIDVPNGRSSHTKPAILGGGVIFLGSGIALSGNKSIATNGPDIRRTNAHCHCELCGRHCEIATESQAAISVSQH